MLFPPQAACSALCRESRLSQSPVHPTHSLHWTHEEKRLLKTGGLLGTGKKATGFPWDTHRLSVLAFLSLLSFDVSSTGLASMQLQPYANSASSSKAKTPEFLHMSSVTTSTTFSRVPALPRLVFVFSRTVWDLVPRPGIKPAPPTLKAQS